MGIARISFLKIIYAQQLGVRGSIIAGINWRRVNGFPRKPEKKAGFIIDFLAMHDPDQEHFSNLNTLLRWATTRDSGLSLFDLPKVVEDLALFAKLKRKRHVFIEKDINQYKTPFDLADALAPHRRKLLPDRHRDQCDARHMGGDNPGARLLVETSDMRVITLLHEDAARDYCRHMRSCMAYTKKPTELNNYRAKYGSVFLIENRKGDRWLLCFGSAQFCDEDDQGYNVPLVPVIGEQPEVVEALQPYFQETLSRLLLIKDERATVIADWAKDIPAWRNVMQNAMDEILQHAKFNALQAALQTALLSSPLAMCVSVGLLPGVIERMGGLQSQCGRDLMVIMKDMPGWRSAVKGVRYKIT